MANAYVDAVTKTIEVNGTSFVYRETGEKNGIPIVLLHHLTAVLDDWDPRTIDSLSQKHRVIAFNDRGVGGSKGTTPDTIDDMATDAVAFIRALGLTKTDVLGFSLAGFIAQVIAQKHPDLVRRMDKPPKTSTCRVLNCSLRSRSNSERAFSCGMTGHTSMNGHSCSIPHIWYAA